MDVPYTPNVWAIHPMPRTRATSLSQLPPDTAALNEIGPRQSRFGANMQITGSQAQQIFTDPDVMPYFPQAQRGDVHAAGNRVDWDFVVDHKRTAIDHDGRPLTPNVNFGLEELDGLMIGRADNHPGVDRLFWGIGNRIMAPNHPALDANNGGHDHTGHCGRLTAERFLSGQVLARGTDGQRGVQDPFLLPQVIGELLRICAAGARMRMTSAHRSWSRCTWVAARME